MAQFPPPDFVQTDSAIVGIEVYMPAPEPDIAPQGVVDFKCPQCGATTAYSVADGGICCEHCGYYESPTREVVGKGAQEFEFKVETLERAAVGWGAQRKELVCENCQAHTSIPVEMLTYTCPFCGSNKVIQRDAAQDVLRPRFLIPFQVTLEGCQVVARQWLGSSWMVPKDLQRLAHVTDFVPIYLPFWTFDAVTTADWRAQVAHTVTERYRSGGEWKTRTRTVWRWESGNVRRLFDDLLIAGTERLSRVLIDRLIHFDLTHLTPYDPNYLAGIRAQAYDVSLEPAWAEARDAMREDTRRACRAQASNSRMRNFTMNLDFAEETWRYVLLPVYVGLFTYANQTFQVMVNGQTAAIAGQRPVDWTKVWLAIGGLLAPGVILGIIGLVTAILGIGVIIGVIGLVLFVIGAIIAFFIYQKAEGMDDV
ncbi:MAG: hypothetical protein JXB35_13415 [Anaerolineae bacterium]|nr:hypothetical protein [Anaerolineae bacterium]